jgi:hypothetical protein
MPNRNNVYRITTIVEADPVFPDSEPIFGRVYVLKTLYVALIRLDEAGDATQNSRRRLAIDRTHIPLR